ncbi:MAG: RpiB/LacA/LacB family sugar-phosphate isomerase, partial [Anaerolineae bacterium]|nr:RpiB/LacA/LacB family sugar-phosphate isomerase [Anaerolineae bacterium]
VKIARAILSGEADRGILLCGSGVGACIAANKIDGIYAGVCHDTYSAHQAVEHDAMNVLCLGARIIGEELAKELVAVFLAAEYSNEERHNRRTGKVRQIEKTGKPG